MGLPHRTPISTYGKARRDPTSPRRVVLRGGAGPKLLEKEHPSFQPVTLDGPGGHTEELRDLPLRKSAEESKFDNLAQSFVDRCEAVEGFVEREDLVELYLERGVPLAQRNACRAAAVLFGATASREVDEHLTHRTGRRPEEVSPAIPIRFRSATQFEKRLVDQLGGRERGERVTSAQVVSSHALELIVGEPIQIVVVRRQG